MDRRSASGSSRGVAQWPSPARVTASLTVAGLSYRVYLVPVARTKSFPSASPPPSTIEWSMKWCWWQPSSIAGGAPAGPGRGLSRADTPTSGRRPLKYTEAWLSRTGDWERICVWPGAWRWPAGAAAPGSSAICSRIAATPPAAPVSGAAGRRRTRPTARLFGDGRLSASELSTDEVSWLYRQAGALGVAQLVVWGGEPLLRPDLPELLLVARSAGLSAAVITNGWLLPERWPELRGTVDTLIVSLDDVGPAHDRLRALPGLYRRLDVVRPRSALGPVATTCAGEHGAFPAQPGGAATGGPGGAGVGGRAVLLPHGDRGDDVRRFRGAARVGWHCRRRSCARPPCWRSSCSAPATRCWPRTPT